MLQGARGCEPLRVCPPARPPARPPLGLAAHAGAFLRRHLPEPRLRAGRQPRRAGLSLLLPEHGISRGVLGQPVAPSGTRTARSRGGGSRQRRRQCPSTSRMLPDHRPPRGGTGKPGSCAQLQAVLSSVRMRMRTQVAQHPRNMEDSHARPARAAHVCPLLGSCGVRVSVFLSPKTQREIIQKGEFGRIRTECGSPTAAHRTVKSFRARFQNDRSEEHRMIPGFLWECGFDLVFTTQILVFRLNLDFHFSL